MSGRILNGWKEIAGYIQRSVRTVQRWECQMGLPVYRPAAKESAVVVAFADELDVWLHGFPGNGLPEEGLPGNGSPEEASLESTAPVPGTAEQLMEEVDTLVADAAELSSRVRMLQEQLRLLHLSPRRPHSGKRSNRFTSAQAFGCLVNFPPPKSGKSLINSQEPQTR